MRHPHDFYPTPVALTDVLLDSVPELSGSAVEPCAGDGAMADALKRSGRLTGVKTNDILAGFGCTTTSDARDLGTAVWQGTADWVITNPPFTWANEILANAWAHAGKGVAMLLRLTFLEPTVARAELLQQLAPFLSDVIVFGQPRPSFTDDRRTDSVTTAWLVWQKGWNQGARVRFAVGWTGNGRRYHDDGRQAEERMTLAQMSPVALTGNLDEARRQSD